VTPLHTTFRSHKAANGDILSTTSTIPCENSQPCRTRTNQLQPRQSLEPWDPCSSPLPTPTGCARATLASTGRLITRHTTKTSQRPARIQNLARKPPRSSTISLVTRNTPRDHRHLDLIPAPIGWTLSGTRHPAHGAARSSGDMAQMDGGATQHVHYIPNIFRSVTK